MSNTVREALRYLGCPGGDAEMYRRAEEQLAQLRGQLRPKTVWRLFPLEHTPEGERLGPVLLPGASARHMLKECAQGVLFACTLGTAFDDMMRARQARSMADAVILDACGSAYTEEVCDGLQQEIAAAVPLPYMTDRFSPGYGDLPLSLQEPILQLLDARRRTGIHLTASGLMNPQKSVTAVIGLSDVPQGARIRGCAYCNMREQCLIRKGGHTCGMGS